MAEGASVTIAGRDLAALQATRDALNARGAGVWSVACDVTDPSSVTQAVGEARSQMGGVDILVNNAGIAPTAPILRLKLEDWNQALAVNATGALLCIQACLPSMLEQKYGRIVNVASVAGISSAPYLAAYSASKHALIGLTRAAAAELVDKGILVNALCPAYIDTDMTRRGVERAVSKGMSESEALSAVLTSAGQKRLLTPEEVASWVVQLVGPASMGLHGQLIVLDGGGVAK